MKWWQRNKTASERFAEVDQMLERSERHCGKLCTLLDPEGGERFKEVGFRSDFKRATPLEVEELLRPVLEERDELKGLSASLESRLGQVTRVSESQSRLIAHLRSELIEIADGARNAHYLTLDKFAEGKPQQPEPSATETLVNEEPAECKCCGADHLHLNDARLCCICADPIRFNEFGRKPAEREEGSDGNA